MSLLSWAAGAYLMALAVGHYFAVGNVRRHNLESASFIFVAVLLVAVASRRPAGSDGDTSTVGDARPWPLLMVLPLSPLLALLIYAPVIGAGLFADDYVLLEAARQGRWTVWTDLFRPVLFPVWRAADAVSRDIAASLHSLNIFLHAANGVMTALLAKRVGLSGWPAAAAGILFLCFPASVEPVAWPAGIQDVLMTTFGLGVLLLLTGSGSTASRATGAVVLLTAAALTKESGLTVAALAFLVCAVVRASRSTWIAMAAAASAALTLLIARVSLFPLPSGYGVLASRYDLKELLVRPFATLIVPFRQVEIAAMPWLATGAVCVVVSALCFTAARWTRGSYAFHRVLFSAAFVLASIAAVNTIFYIDGELLGSRYLYLGSVGWAILLATILREATLRSVIVGAILALLTTGSWIATARAHANLWKEAAAHRELILDAAVRASSPECVEMAVDGLPEVHQGVPLFVNGFPEAMRQRRSTTRFRVATDGTAECRLVWTGTTLRRP